MLFLLKGLPTATRDMVAEAVALVVVAAVEVVAYDDVIVNVIMLLFVADQGSRA